MGDFEVRMSVEPRRSNGGRLKALMSFASTALAVAGIVFKLTDIHHSLLSTIIFSFVVVYIVIDIAYWRKHPTVWLLGPLTIGVAAYWWVGFMALHNIPPEPLLPAAWYPPRWGYLVMAAWMFGYAVWDIIDARMNRYRDERSLEVGAVLLIVGVGFCLYQTLKVPAAGGAM